MSRLVDRQMMDRVDKKTQTECAHRLVDIRGRQSADSGDREQVTDDCRGLLCEDPEPS